ncbi:MAG: tRNA (adenosine(37)-N6)-threonylcarbamoyltransferase complex transferase subunit TsaD [Pseudomonadota bacterium]
MLTVLGVETSCDETAVAVTRGSRPLSSVVASQTEIHARYGGVVPELASRRHLEAIVPVAQEALRRAGLGASDIDAVAVAQGPGLVGALLVGICFAKSFAYAVRGPLIGLSHLEAHVFAIFAEAEPSFPFTALLVSGGHTNLYAVEGFLGNMRLLGQTRDDAAGEAFDKAARLLGLAYPGGPNIEEQARRGRPGVLTLPRAYLGPKKSHDFSFSGLKTAVSLYLKRNPDASVPDVAREFQEAVVEVLVTKAVRAAREQGHGRLVLAGGVAANGRLREAMRAECAREGIEIFIPSMDLCTDNAAMIALAGFFRLRKGERSGLDLDAYSRAPTKWHPPGGRLPTSRKFAGSLHERS